jgi:hypothetical protein
VYFSNTRFGTEDGFALGAGPGDDVFAAGVFFGGGVVACPATIPVRSTSREAADNTEIDLLGMEGSSDGVGKPITATLRRGLLKVEPIAGR